MRDPRESEGPNGRSDLKEKRKNKRFVVGKHKHENPSRSDWIQKRRDAKDSRSSPQKRVREFQNRCSPPPYSFLFLHLERWRVMNIIHLPGSRTKDHNDFQGLSALLTKSTTSLDGPELWSQDEQWSLDSNFPEQHSRRKGISRDEPETQCSRMEFWKLFSFQIQNGSENDELSAGVLVQLIRTCSEVRGDPEQQWSQKDLPERPPDPGQESYSE